MKRNLFTATALADLLLSPLALPSAAEVNLICCPFDNQPTAASRTLFWLASQWEHQGRHLSTA